MKKCSMCKKTKSLNQFYQRKRGKQKGQYDSLCKKCKIIDNKKYAKNRVAILDKKYHRLYSKWLGMKARCYRKTIKSYKYYGARKIKVCKEWKNDFSSFYRWAMSTNYHEGLYIDRRDVNKNYTPENCRFVTKTESSQYGRRWNKLSHKKATIIRKLKLRNPKLTWKELSKKFKCSESNIGMVLLNITWVK